MKFFSATIDKKVFLANVTAFSTDRKKWRRQTMVLKISEFSCTKRVGTMMIFSFWEMENVCNKSNSWRISNGNMKLTTGAYNKNSTGWWDLKNNCWAEEFKPKFVSRKNPFSHPNNTKCKILRENYIFVEFLKPLRPLETWEHEKVKIFNFMLGVLITSSFHILLIFDELMLDTEQQKKVLFTFFTLFSYSQLHHHVMCHVS